MRTFNVSFLAVLSCIAMIGATPVERRSPAEAPDDLSIGGSCSGSGCIPDISSTLGNDGGGPFPEISNTLRKLGDGPIPYGISTDLKDVGGPIHEIPKALGKVEGSPIANLVPNSITSTLGKDGGGPIPDISDPS